MSMVLALVAGACGDDTDDAGASSTGATVVVTTSILGDVVGELVGDAATVEVIMPPNADPHDFAPSAQQAALMREADALVVNGLGFEEGLVDAIEGAEADGVVVIAATDGVEELLELGEHGHEDEPADEGEEEHADEDDGDDPHVFTDPTRMAGAAALIADELARAVDRLDTPAFRDRVDAYLGELADLDAEVEAVLEAVPAERRVLVTNHEVFGYFADRYGFEVLGVVIPGGSTLAEPSARDLADLAEEIDEEGVPAIFAEASSPSALADALAAEGVSVEVVELFSESLGEPGSGAETYLELVRTNAERIAAGLAG
jgi:zinc/manganese transport system substrate-binding protein